MRSEVGSRGEVPCSGGDSAGTPWAEPVALCWYAPVIHMLAVARGWAARVVIVPLTLGQLFVLLFIGCGNHMEPNDGCPHGLAKHMLCSGFEEEWES